MNFEEYIVHNHKKYIIFDLDGTLARLEIDWSTYRREIFDLVATFDKSLTQQVAFTPLAGMELANLAIKKHGDFAKKKIDIFVEKYEISHYLGYTQNPELLDFIQKNRNNYVYFMWTSNMKKTFQDFLSKENLEGVFSSIVDRGSVLLLKPEIDGFHRIFKSGTQLGEYLMVGDSTFDEFAAKNAGIDFLKIDYFDRQ